MTETPDPSITPTNPGARSSMPIPPWSSLDASARMVAGAGIAVVALALIGAILGAWSSTAFTILLLVTGLIGAGLAWFGGSPALRDQPIPLPAIESIAALIAAVLSVVALIELLFDLDQLDGIGDFLGAVIVVATAAAAVAFLIGTTRRDPATRAAATTRERATMLAVGGFALVLVGWAVNVSLGYWNLDPGVVTLALVSLALGLVLVAPRIHPSLAWLGAAVAALALLIGFGLWGSLMSQGNEIELSVIDIGAMLLTFVGIVLLGVGAVLAGLPTVTAPAENAQPPAGPLPPDDDGAV
ncbi:MAG TPA: hypothetical protein VD763_11185 [Candidatus Saccharimonadales bacterium]|nr:hypothetical protein [Candidatus Saccharimonadales bacterium]